jgi:predicted RNA binding protein YcfA (HicA-like mRNA interferase family)
VTARASIRRLRQLGCESVRPKGSHEIWRCGHGQTVIRFHTGDIATGTLRSIVRDLEPGLGAKWLTQ